MNVVDIYQSLSEWCFDHQSATDVIVVGIIVAGTVMGLNRKRRMRRIARRLRWGITRMTREQREWLILQRLEDGLMDALMEMVHDGTINESHERVLMARLATGGVKFEGLKPKKNVKRGIQVRLKRRFGLKPARIPGDKPGVDKVDKSYTPNSSEMKSRYVR